MWGGSGSALHPAVLATAGICTLVATVVSAGSIYLHLKNYRKPTLQRMVIRIMLMVPIYAISSLIALFSLEAAFIIDAIRDIYEAFVIYCFFHLLVGYLGGERSLLILLHGRPPKYHVFPVNIFQHELDVSDPYTFLHLKRGIMQYVQIKPILAISTVILKVAGKYGEGDLRADAGYLYISLVYNVSIFISLYCLAMFWMVVNADLQPFRPMPKFLCVKGILFFSFWQSLFISILVTAGAIKQLGPYTDTEHISLALTDTLICFEMPFFAIAHMYAFSAQDYVDPKTQYAARMPMWYALRDALGVRDLITDFAATLRGDGVTYRTWEPAEGAIHQGEGRARRIAAGLRYAHGGRTKYWLPMPDEPQAAPTDGVIRRILRGGGAGSEYAPLPGAPAIDNGEIHLAPDLQETYPNLLDDAHVPDDDDGDDDDSLALRFAPPTAEEDAVYAHSRQLLFGDYHYPCIDVSGEAARGAMWAEEERILRHQCAAAFSPVFGSKSLAVATATPVRGYGALAEAGPRGDYFAQNGGSSGSLDVLLSPTQIDGPAVIDYAADRIADMDESDVRMGWARTASQRQSTGTPRQGPAQLRNETAGTPRPEAVGTPRHSTPPRTSTPRQSGARTESSASAGSAPAGATAVDLVVEDAAAAEERLTRARRKGGPVRGPSLGKVYRREYVVRDGNPLPEDGGAAIDDGDAAPGEIVEAARADEETLISTEVDIDDVVSPHEPETPPPIRRAYAPSVDDANPWA